MREETIRFGRSQHLVGTITHPADAAAADQARIVVLLTNAGFISRIGPRRINVRIAHRLARLGIASLRWDLSGLGDSSRPAGDGAAGEQFVRDTVDAMEEASALTGAGAFVMIGFCSGAQVAFRTALRDDRLLGLVLFDHFKFPTLKSKARWALRRLKAAGLRGFLPAIASGVRRRIASLRERLRQGRARTMHNAELADPTLEEYASLVQSLVGRGVRLFFVYSGGFPRVFNYARQFDDLYARFGIPARVTCAFLPNTDHLVTSAAEQGRLIDLIVSWVATLAREARPEGGTGAGASAGGRPAATRLEDPIEVPATAIAPT